MAELTEQQIEQAIVAFNNFEGHQKTGEILSMKERMLRAAPYLQLPWDELTEVEIQSALITFDNSLRMRVDSQEARLDAMAQSLGWLIASRNAALQPKPVDPQREKIVDAIHRYGYFGNKEALADDIIAALGEVK